MFSTINWYIKDEIGYLVLNKPPANSMNRLFFEEISSMTENYFTKNIIKAALVQAEGRHFSSGADIRDLLSIGENNSDAEVFYHKNSKAFQSIYHAPFPVVCLLKGVCIGSALELALSCHFRFATGKILMGFPEAGYNLMTGCGGSFFLSEIADKKNCMEMMLAGKNIETEEARQLGLIDAVLPKDEISLKAVNFAMKISEGYNKKLKEAYLKKYFSK